MPSSGPSSAPDEGIGSLPELQLQRLRIGLRVCLLIYLLFAIFVLGDAGVPADTRLQVAVLRGVCVAAFAAALVALRSRAVQRQALPLGVAAIALVAVSSGISGVLIPRDSVLVPMSFVVMSMFTAALVPWGWRTQALIVSVQAATLAGAAVLVPGGKPSALLAPTMLLTFVAFAVSVLLALLDAAPVAGELARHATAPDRADRLRRRDRRWPGAERSTAGWPWAPAADYRRRPCSLLASAACGLLVGFALAWSARGAAAADGGGCPPPAAAADWQVAEPAAAGFDPATLCAVVEAAANGDANVHAVLVARHGQLVAERYRSGPDTPITVRYGLPNPFASAVAFDAGTLHDVRSISKSVVGLLVGIAEDQGRLASLATPVLDAYPELASLRTPPRDAITIENLLTMSSGLEWDEWSAGILTSDETRLFWTADQVGFLFDRPQAAAPGTVFNYNGGGTQTLADLLRRATGTPVDALARAQLFEPLGIAQWEWGTDLRGRPLAFAGLRLRPRDLAKLGRLVLDGGRWQGRQLVPEAWVAESLRPHLSTGFTGFSLTGDSVGYGYQWWTGNAVWNGRQISWSAGVGNGGQRLYVVPELDLVIVMTAGEYGAPRITQTANRLLAGVLAAAH